MAAPGKPHQSRQQPQLQGPTFRRLQRNSGVLTHPLHVGLHLEPLRDTCQKRCGQAIGAIMEMALQVELHIVKRCGVSSQPYFPLGLTRVVVGGKTIQNLFEKL